MSRTRKKPKVCGSVQQSLDKLTEVLKFYQGKLACYYKYQKYFLSVKWSQRTQLQKNGFKNLKKLFAVCDIF